MKTNIKLLSALLALAFVAMSASAQQPSRRNGSDAANRQENKVERQQTKVDKVQRPTNISNQNATDRKVRDAGISSGSMNGGSSFGNSSGSVNSGGNRNGNSGSHGGSANNDGARRPSGGSMNNGSSSSQHGGSVLNGGKVSGHGNGSAIHNNGGAVHNGSSHGNVSNHNNGSAIHNNGSNHGNAGSHGNGGSMNHNGSVNHGAGNRPPQGGHVEHGRRPSLPPVIVYTRPQVYERTNSNSIVVNTLFSSKAEAYDYIATLLDARYYTIASYGNNYNWLKTEVAFIPTPFDWTNPMTHNQFRMEFDITRSLFGTVKVTITAYWRESVLSTGFTRLRFQPSDRYSTYYAWRVLEDIASNIPNSSVYYN